VFAKFPQLKGKYEEDHDEVIDDAAYEFMKEIRDELKREEAQPYQEPAFHDHVKKRLQQELGPFYRGSS
jgi:hypothetical protein